MEMLVEWNEKINLTSITDPDQVVEKHFLDSLTLLEACPPKEGARVADVGTGAGFPGLALKIARPDIALTLLDGVNKKLTFLGEVCQALGLEAERVHKRAEEAGRDRSMRENFDLVTGRAVAALNVLSEYCLPLVRIFRRHERARSGSGIGGGPAGFGDSGRRSHSMQTNGAAYSGRTEYHCCAEVGIYAQGIPPSRRDHL
jgi:16S rRNA (guanine(527)-N(7))-methyltransferase RsmG